MVTSIKNSTPFVGRKQEIMWLRHMIDEGVSALLIQGYGGLGKSTLAQKLLSQYQAQGYQVITFQGKVTPEMILESILETFTGQSSSGNSTHLQLESKFRLVLEHYLIPHKVILFFDNFEDNQVQYQGDITSTSLLHYLQVISQGLFQDQSCMLFTSRYSFPNLKVSQLKLNELNHQEAFEKMTYLKNLSELSKELKQKILQLIGGHPQALELLNQVLNESNLSWDKLERLYLKPVQSLTNNNLLLEILWSHLSDVEQEILQAAAVFRLRVSSVALESVLDQSLSAELLKRLQDISLIHTSDSGLHYVHRITAEFVLDRQRISPIQSEQLHARACRFYEQALQQERTLEHYVEARYHALESGDVRRAAQISIATQDLLRLKGYIEGAWELNQEILTMIEDSDIHGACYHNLGIIASECGRWDEAMTFYDKAIVLFQEIGNQHFLAKTTHQQGLVYQSQGNYKRARELFLKVKDIFSDFEDKRSEASAIHQLGLIAQEQELYPEAMSYYSQALPIFMDLDLQSEVAAICGQAGKLHLIAGNYGHAMNLFREALKIFKSFGYPGHIATIYCQIGTVHRTINQFDKAENYYKQAQKIFESIDYMDGVAGVYSQMGLLNQMKKEYLPALSYFNQALELFQSKGHPMQMASTHRQLAEIYFLLNDHSHAISNALVSLSIFIQLDSIYSHSTFKLLANIAYKLKWETFMDYFVRSCQRLQLSDENKNKCLGLIKQALDNHAQSLNLN